jgi:hypothetical protein
MQLVAEKFTKFQMSVYTLMEERFMLIVGPDGINLLPALVIGVVAIQLSFNLEP